MTESELQEFTDHYGKSISQKMDGMRADMDNPDGKILSLTQTELVIQATEATMRFVKP